MKPSTQPFTFEELNTVLRYVPRSGNFYWRVDVGSKLSCRAGARAGGVSGRMWALRYRHAPMAAHRVAWLLMTGEWPTLEIDHANRNPFDNRWRNLRLATSGQNLANSGPGTSTGFKGVYVARSGRYEARMNAPGVRGSKYIGTFNTPEEAARVADAAAFARWGEFAYLNFPKEHRHAA